MPYMNNCICYITMPIQTCIQNKIQQLDNRDHKEQIRRDTYSNINFKMTNVKPHICK